MYFLVGEGAKDKRILFFKQKAIVSVVLLKILGEECFMEGKSRLGESLGENHITSKEELVYLLWA